MLFRGRLMQAFLFAAFNQLPKCAVHDKEYIIYIKVVCNKSLGIQKDNRMAAMLDDKTKGSVIQHGCINTVFLISSRNWLQTTYNNGCAYSCCTKRAKSQFQSLIISGLSPVRSTIRGTI